MSISLGRNFSMPPSQPQNSTKLDAYEPVWLVFVPVSERRAAHAAFGQAIRDHYLSVGAMVPSCDRPLITPVGAAKLDNPQLAAWLLKLAALLCCRKGSANALSQILGLGRQALGLRARGGSISFRNCYEISRLAGLAADGRPLLPIGMLNFDKS